MEEKLRIVGEGFGALRAVSATVAEAVYHAAVNDGVATKTHDHIVQAILDTMWVPKYD